LYPEFAGKFYTRLGPLRDLLRNASRAIARHSNAKFRGKLNKPVFGYFTDFEKQKYGVTDKMTLAQAVHVAYSDMLDDFTEAKLALLNEFYAAHFQINSCADLAYDTLSFFKNKYSKY
jgi:hypothetical protein